MSTRLVFHFYPKDSDPELMTDVAETLHNTLMMGDQPGVKATGVVSLPEDNQITLVNFTDDGFVDVEHFNRGFDDIGDPIINNNYTNVYNLGEDTQPNNEPEYIVDEDEVLNLQSLEDTLRGIFTRNLGGVLTHDENIPVFGVQSDGEFVPQISRPYYSPDTSYGGPGVYQGRQYFGR